MALNVSKICFNCKPTNQQTKYLKQYLKEAKYKSIKSGILKNAIDKRLKQEGYVNSMAARPAKHYIQLHQRKEITKGLDFPSISLFINS